MTTEQQTSASLVLPAGYAYMQNQGCKKLHLIRVGNSTAMCGAVQHDQVAISRITARADEVCKRCVKVAQRKGLGLHYE